MTYKYKLVYKMHNCCQIKAYLVIEKVSRDLFHFLYIRRDFPLPVTHEIQQPTQLCRFKQCCHGRAFNSDSKYGLEGLQRRTFSPPPPLFLPGQSVIDI